VAAVHFLAAQQLAHPIAHFVGGVLGVGERKYLVGIGVALSDQPSMRWVRTEVLPVPAASN